MELIQTCSFVHKNTKQEILMHVKISLCSEIEPHSENFAIVAKFRYYCENFAILAKFHYYSEIVLDGTVHQCWLLFHCSLLLLFTLHYSISSCFDILHSRLAEIDKNTYEIDGNQPDFVMIGLTQRFGSQFLKKLQKQPRNAIRSTIWTRTCQLG